MHIKTFINDALVVGAQYVDHVGPVGPVVYGNTHEEAVFKLGYVYGARPQEFSRPLDEIVEAPVENI